MDAVKFGSVKVEGEMAIIEAIKAQAHKLAASRSGHAYNSQRLDAIIDAGVIPEGAVLMVVGQQVAKLEGGEVVTYGPDGKVARRTPATADRSQELMAYAITASALGTRVGA